MSIRWIDPTLPAPWEAVYLAGEGWTVLAPWTGEGERRCRPHVAEVGGWETSAECRAEAERIVAWCPQARPSAEQRRSDAE